MFEDPDCVDCDLHLKCKHRCLPSIGDQDCKLAIFLDQPGFLEDRKGLSWVGDSAAFVMYCLRRMSVDPDLVYRDYIIKCYTAKLPGKKPERMGLVRACSQYRFASLQEMPHLKAVVVLGALGCETMTHCKTVGDKQGAEWEPISPLMRQHVPHVWVGFSPGLLREKAGEAGSIYRVIFMAAKEAGLNPKPNLAIKPYEFPTD